ncbi:putative bifunctional diguanylate cyclase/phosphodiesterase [Burkholderia gladioli]|uniref:putative bifunctional diguanylate cyclase/phosphodiesterase n=1 Tax=Burkholderia gladioli TaxID=28095 RepID=UPI000CFF8D52|nr:GGDEF domain-containing phosphodiesterase [Burkholderia gladioli]PRH35218.1 GGDEF domain-containing protein [Burkholderia gladioli]
MQRPETRLTEPLAAPDESADPVPRRSDATRIERAISQATQPVCLCSADGTLTWTNAAFERLTGRRAGVPGTVLRLQSMLVAPGDSWASPSIDALLRGGAIWLLQRPAGDGVPVRIVLSALLAGESEGGAAAAPALGAPRRARRELMREAPRDDRAGADVAGTTRSRTPSRLAAGAAANAVPASVTAANRREPAGDAWVVFMSRANSDPPTGGELWYAANYDDTTRLPNRKLFAERLDLRIARARATDGRFSIVLLEIGGLSTIRNALGLPGVELAVRVTGERLRTKVPHLYGVASMGDGKFALLCDEAEPVVRRLVETIVAVAGEPIEFAGAALNVIANAGTAAYPEQGEDTDTLIRRANVALSAALEAGDGIAVPFSSALELRATRRFELEAALARGIDRQQFWLAYQPQVTLETGRIAQVEALLRWRHPRSGEISPNEFIPIAEESGLIDRIGEWAIRTACREISRLHRDSEDAPRVCVNVSPQQFRRGNLLAIIEQALDDSGLAPHQLEIEITEGVLFGDTEAALDTVSSIRQLGVEIAVDDFGTGYSSLSYLTRFPVNRVKIDRAFVAPLPSDARSAELVAAIIAMAHALKMRVTAEGVETIEQANQLLALGCDEAQGFWYARPHSFGSLRTLIGM